MNPGFILSLSLSLSLSALGMLPMLGCGGVPLDAIGPSHSDLGEGVLAHWALDDGTGTIAKDSSGSGRDGQLTGGSWISDGRFAGALRLAAGDSATVANFPNATPNFTVATWLRLSPEQLAMNDGMWVAILGNENFGAGGWQLNIDNRLARPRLDFAYWSSPLTGYLFVECECVELDRWIHLAAVVDVEADRVTLYKNGAVQDQETRPSDILPGDPTLYWGGWNMSGRQLSGDLDDVAIWNRALTANEIAALAESPVPG
jgi:hypothetical protein